VNQGLEEPSSIFNEEERDQLNSAYFEAVDPHGGLASLWLSVKGIKNKIAGGGENGCHGVSFGSMQEAVLWCNEKNLLPGLMVDSKVLLHCIQPTVMTQIQATKGIESQKKVDIETNLEAAVLTSFQGTVPSVLVGGKTDLEGGPFEVLHNYQKSFDKWDPPGQGKGLKARIANGVQAETLLKSSGVPGEAYTLAMGLTHDSAHFLNELASWKTNAYCELTSDTAIPKEAVWEMIIE